MKPNLTKARPARNASASAAPSRHRFSRAFAVAKARAQLERSSFPPLQMGLIVATTGALGLLSSFLMLHAGVDLMAVRYPLALAVAYAGFLGMLWLWLRFKHDDLADLGNLVDIPASLGGGPDGTCAPGFSSGVGGDFAGAGASGTFDPVTGEAAVPRSITKGASEVAGDLDDFAVPLAAIVIAIGLALASVYVIYMAPALFAELLVDGVLSVTLYKHLKRADSRHWLWTAVCKTALPFALTAVFLCAMGAAMSWYAPGARSIGEIGQHQRASR